MAKTTAKRDWRTRAALPALALALVLAALAIGPSAARAEDQQDIARCKGEADTTPEQQIAACTALIETAGREGRDLALAYFHRAAAYLKRQDFDSAIRDFDAGLAQDADNAAAWFGRGVAHEGKGEPEGAIDDYNAAIKRDPDNVKALSNRAAIYADQRAYERALEDNNRVVDLAPDEPRSYISRRVDLRAPRRLRECAA